MRRGLDQRCEFFPEDNVKQCPEPATYKLVWVGWFPPYTDIRSDRLCKEHYELMADLVVSKTDSDWPAERRRAERMMELNNWFQHE